MKSVVHSRRAFMPDPDAPNPGNPIHSTAAAQARGFRGALVGGATVYGWAVGAIIESLGVSWLDHGWAEVRFRRPVYPDDALTIDVRDGEFSVGVDGTTCVDGSVGSGDAPWLAELTDPLDRTPRPPADPLPRLSPSNVPKGADLRARAVPISRAESEAFLRQKQDEASPLFYGAGARLHPAWVASQPIYLLHHSFDYGPAIHTASRVQHLRRTAVDQTIVVAGRCVDAFERNGHHYIVNDTVLTDESHELFARIRHTAIYRLRENT